MPNDTLHIKAVGKARPFMAKGKPQTSYGLLLEEFGDEWFDFVEWDGDTAPSKGDAVVEAEIVEASDPKWNRKVYGKLSGPTGREQVAQGTTPASHQRDTTTAHGAAQSSPRPVGPDERESRIVRQHSQEMALRALPLDPQATIETIAGLQRLIRTWTDWFYADAFAASSPQASPVAPAGEAPPSTIDEARKTAIVEAIQAHGMSPKLQSLALVTLGVENAEDLDAAYASLTPAQADQFEREYLGASAA